MRFTRAGNFWLLFNRRSAFYSPFMVELVCIGDWPRGSVSICSVPSGRRLVPQVEAAIGQAWKDARLRLGKSLFDGPLCRVENVHALSSHLELELSPTSFRPFLGTNLTNPQFAQAHGPDVMANPLGVSALLISNNGWIILGQRGESVAHYPGRLHCFAGCVEPRDADVFTSIERELSEELSLKDDELAEIHCIGLARDPSLLQPELIFEVPVALDEQQLTARLDKSEHDSICNIRSTAEGVNQMIEQGGSIRGRVLTPIAMAAILLWGRRHLGNHWFARAAATVTSPTFR